MLSCGDLPFPLQSCYLSSPVKIESITLADDSPIVMARNVLFAKIITNSHFDVSNSEDIEYLWDIWYNMEWPAKTLQRFLQDLKDLAEDNISPNLKIPSTVDKDHLKTIWGFWISSASEMNPTSMKILHEQRLKKSIYCYQLIQSKLIYIQIPINNWSHSWGFISKPTSKGERFHQTTSITSMGVDECSYH